MIKRPIRTPDMMIAKYLLSLTIEKKTLGRYSILHKTLFRNQNDNY